MVNGLGVMVNILGVLGDHGLVVQESEFNLVDLLQVGNQVLTYIIYLIALSSELSLNYLIYDYIHIYIFY